MPEILPGVPILHPRLRNSARNLILLSGPDIRQWLYDLGQRLDDVGQRAGELWSAVDALRAELNGVRNDFAQQLRQTESGLDAITARVDDLAVRLSGLASPLRGDYYQREDRPDSIEYWTRHNVTVHHPFTSVEDSLNQLQFRNQQYPGYIDLLPVSGKDGMAVLDYGCGPGHDLVGFAHYSRPKRLVGVDISPSSLAEAAARLKLHDAQAELVRVDYGAYDLPFDAASFDYIHCSGVLMCIEEPARLLREFARLLTPGGELRLMVYNYDSIWLHLYVAYVVQIENGLYRDLPTRVAFTRTTDGEDCPVNAVWRPEEMIALGREAGFDAEFLGAALSLWELHILPRRHIACLSRALPNESRSFLQGLRLDPQGHPWHNGHRAGVDGCFRFRRVT
jgi:ubiquinone/menaquinone biosynthesis C-methylase UbiE